MILYFDIGSTLIDGPPVGPARRLGEVLSLSKTATDALNRLLFTVDFANPAELASLICERYGTDLAATLRHVTALWESQAEEAYILPGAEETLERLLQAGFQLAFISNIWTPFYQGFCRCLPHLAQAHPEYLSFRLGTAKPDLSLYHQALWELDADPARTLMIGDTYQNDILPAMRLNMGTVWLLHRPAKEKADLVATLNGALPMPDLTLGSIADIEPEALRELIQRKTS